MKTKNCWWGGLYMILSLVFIFVNILYLNRFAPWGDEVMIADTPLNLVQGNGWTPHAWEGRYGVPPFSTYTPLMQFLQVGWFFIFGYTYLSNKLLSLTMTFVLGFVMLKLIALLGGKLSKIGVVIFSLLFWGSYDFMIIYRNGRPDILCALIAVITIYFFIRTIKESVNNYAIIISSALLFLSGIAVSVFVFFVISYLWIVLEQKRDILKKVFIRYLIGIFIGISIFSFHLFLHDHLLVFVIELFSFSTTTKSLIGFLLPLVGEMGINVDTWVEKLNNDPVSDNFIVKILSVFYFFSYTILIVLNLLLLIRERRKNKMSFREPYVLIVLFSCLVPILMNIAGRFVSYYQWMAYLPILVATMLIFDRLPKKYTAIIFIISITVISEFFVKMNGEDDKYTEIHNFVKKQNFKKTDMIASPYCMFYDLAHKSKNVYYVCIFQEEFLPREVDYIITVKDGNKYDKRVDNFCEKRRNDPSLIVSLIDTSSSGKYLLYKVVKK